MTFQELDINLIKTYLDNKVNYTSPASRYMLGDFVGQYPEEYIDKDGAFKYWLLDYKVAKNQNRWNYLMGSTAAIQSIKDMQENKIPLSTYKKQHSIDQNYPFYEHLEPRSLTCTKLLNLKAITHDTIKEALQYSHLLLITKAESKLLDTQTFNEADQEVLFSMGTEEYAIESLQSIRKDSKYLTCKSNGTSLARLVHLSNAGVEFYLGDKKVEPTYINFVNYIKSGYIINNLEV